MGRHTRKALPSPVVLQPFVKNRRKEPGEWSDSDGARNRKGFPTIIERN